MLALLSTFGNGHPGWPGYGLDPDHARSQRCKKTLIKTNAYLAGALLDAGEGDEVEVRNGAYMRRAVIEKSPKQMRPRLFEFSAAFCDLNASGVLRQTNW